MPFKYRELSEEWEIQQCLELQRNVFKFTDTDLISPLFFKLISRNLPPMGIAVGAFKESNNESELIGVIVGFATFIPKSIYITILGTKPDLQNSIFGHKLLLKMREIAISRGIEHLFGVFDIYNLNLNRLYIESLGFQGIQFMKVPEKEKTNLFFEDKLLVKWDLNSEHTINKLTNKSRHSNPLDDNAPDEAIYKTIEIPSHSNTSEIAAQLVDTFRNNLSSIMENLQYIITDCISIKSNGERRSFYILTKP